CLARCEPENKEVSVADAIDSFPTYDIWRAAQCYMDDRSRFQAGLEGDPLPTLVAVRHPWRKLDRWCA
ncbi:MAG: hypothetical protein WD005_03570, partial [Haliea sp.]